MGRQGAFVFSQRVFSQCGIPKGNILLTPLRQIGSFEWQWTRRILESYPITCMYLTQTVNIMAASVGSLCTLNSPKMFGRDKVRQITLSCLTKHRQHTGSVVRPTKVLGQVLTSWGLSMFTCSTYVFLQVFDSIYLYHTKSNKNHVHALYRVRLRLY